MAGAEVGELALGELGVMRKRGDSAVVRISLFERRMAWFSCRFPGCPRARLSGATGRSSSAHIGKGSSQGGLLASDTALGGFGRGCGWWPADPWVRSELPELIAACWGVRLGGCPIPPRSLLLSALGRREDALTAINDAPQLVLPLLERAHYFLPDAGLRLLQSYVSCCEDAGREPDAEITRRMRTVLAAADGISEQEDP